MTYPSTFAKTPRPASVERVRVQEQWWARLLREVELERQVAHLDLLAHRRARVGPLGDPALGVKTQAAEEPVLDFR
jgi:hypothetical protein